MKLTEELILFVNEHECDDVHQLTLQSHKYPQIDIDIAIRQISGRRIAKEKLPLWYANRQIIYPKHLSLEQSSSQATAEYRASLSKGETMVDLTGGLGVDFSFIAPNYKDSTYVEQQEYLTELATHNFEVLALNAKIVNTDSRTYLQLMPHVDLIYIDPARRNDVGRKTVLIEDCTPNILEMENLLEEKADRIMIKLSPMLDISLGLKSLKNVSQVHIISVNNECKELLFIKKRGENETTFYCVNILNDRTDIFTFTKSKEQAAKVFYNPNPGKYLYEPNASILKAGAYKSTAEVYGIDKLHINSHLYTSDSLLHDFNGRIFEIDNALLFNKKNIKEVFSTINQANITTRNFPLSVNEIRKKTGIKEGGDVYIFATTLNNGNKVLIICQKVK